MKRLLALVLSLLLAFGTVAVLRPVLSSAEAGGEALSLTWTPGSYYDSINTGHATTRRYTVIPCQEGDKITFTMPSTNWRLWVYPADGTGSIKYFEAKNGMEYTVADISGRMPTELRVTACPNPDSVITDEMWNAFDVTISKEEAVITDSTGRVWQKGSYYDSINTGHATTRRYTVIPCQEGDKVTFTMPSTNWRLWVYPADGTGSIKYFEAKNGMEYTVADISGRMPTELRVTACPNPDSVITDEMWNAFDVTITKEEAVITDSTGRVWQKGSYYDSINTGHATTRRYTVIPCNEGDKVTFTMPSTNWRLWVYPADGTGSIKYFEAKNGMEYTVADISGRMPTELRVTACPNPDSVITDEMWNAFDVTITKEEAVITDSTGRVWQKGSYYDSINTGHATTRRYTVIPCNEGDKVTFTMPSTNWRLWVYPADGTGSINYFEAKNGTEYTIADISGRMPTELRVTACPNPDGVITQEMWNAFDVTITKEEAAITDSTGREWQKGSYYDSINTGHANTRRYTVIPCNEGDKVTFTMPSTNWRLWVYPADGTGSINYFEAKNGTEYTIADINGRMPAELRVTACPNPDGTITEEMWKNFDAVITVTPAAPEEPEEKDLFAVTWNKGSYYESVNTGHANIRRYTVLDCEEGQVFSFVMPSTNWRLWVYPADGTGAINYFEAKDGMEYTVKAINGRMPKELRVTACPNPDSVLTDEMWEKFDAQCFVKQGTVGETLADYNLFRTADWKLGSYYGNAVHGSGNRRHAIFPCEENDTFRFTFASKNFGLWVYYYDKNGELTDFGYTTVDKDTEIKITEKNGKVPSELRISVYPIPDGEITAAMWENFDVTCTRSSDHIRVATMNYGLWNDGTTKYVEDDKVESVSAAWKKMLDDNDPDILCGQEWLPFFDRSNKLMADDVLFAYKYRYQYSTSSGNGKNLVSKTECTDYAANNFSNGKGRQYTKAYTEINGKKVCIINAHCSLETDFNVARKAEFEELIRIMKQEQYVIVFGDFNAYSVAEFDLFKNAGFRIANGGSFGTFDTWTNFDKPSYWANKAIDNIIVSSNIKILDVKVDRRDLSDHNMLVADLQLLDKAEEPDNPGTSDAAVRPFLFGAALLSLVTAAGVLVFRRRARFCR